MKDFFSFSSFERRAVLLLLVLIILVFSIPYAYQAFFKPATQSIDSTYLSQINLFEQQLKLNLPQNDSSVSHQSIRELKIHNFDPNKVSYNQLIEMGVKKAIAHTITNYTSKGGLFYSKSDLKKIYKMDDSTYLVLEPFIIIEEKEPSWKKENKIVVNKTEKKTQPLIELNTADSAALEALPMINPSLAARILKYRNMLGGFYSINQLYEVYYLDSVVVKAIKSRITIDTTAIRPININAATYNVLKRNPYLKPYDVKAILKYREQRGAIISNTELLSNKVVYKETYLKVRYYLKCN